MSSFSTEQKLEILSRIEGKMSSNVTNYSQSFVGRDFKVWAQIAPFILKPFLSFNLLNLGISLSRVCLHAYKMYVHLCDTVYLLYTYNL